MKTTPILTIRHAVRIATILFLSLLILGISRTTYASPQTIGIGGTWYDNNWNPVEAHGEGMIKVGNTYYQIGEDKTNGGYFQNNNCYSTTDLVHFTFVNHVLTLQSSGDLGPNRIVERPKILYNASTSTYVMYMHIDNASYTERKVGVATSSTVCGNYTYQGSFKPLGYDSLDMNLFEDSNGTGYLIGEDRTDALTRIYQLTTDYRTVASLVYSDSSDYEAPAIAKVGNTYYWFGSHLSGWATNDNQYQTATSLSGPWSGWQSFAPAGTNTCNSQTAYILPVVGTNTTTVVYMGDRWVQSNLASSTYIWLPLTINGTSVSMSCLSQWQLDTSTGVWPVQAATYDDSSSPFVYIGTWWHGTCNSGDNCYDNTNSWDNTTNDYVTVTFSGTQIKLYGVKDPGHGIGAVSIDGGSETNVDFYASTRAGNQLLWTSPTLSNGTHTFKLRVTGNKNASSSGTWIVPDAVTVVDSIVSGSVYTLTNVMSGQALDNGNTTTVGAYAMQWSPNGGSTQQWKIVSVGNGYYTLTNVMSGQNLDNGNTTTVGANVMQWTANGVNTQNWKIVSVGNGIYTLTNQMSGQNLDNGNTTTVGAYAMQWTAYSPAGSTQQWQIQ